MSRTWKYTHILLCNSYAEIQTFSAKSRIITRYTRKSSSNWNASPFLHQKKRWGANTSNVISKCDKPLIVPEMETSWTIVSKWWQGKCFLMYSNYTSLRSAEIEKGFEENFNFLRLCRLEASNSKVFDKFVSA